MAKKKEKCQHGLSPVYMSGCPHCVSDAMRGLHIMQDNGIDSRVLWLMLNKAFASRDAFHAAAASARESLAEMDAAIAAGESK